jgi:hypothetical protein
VARHRSPRSRGARRTSPSSGAILAAGAGGAHRVSVGASYGVSALASRRGLLAAGGVAVVLGQAALSHVVDPGRPLLPDLGGVFGASSQEADAVPAVPAASVTSVAGPARGPIEPVRPAPVEELGRADVESLVKAAGLAEAARTAAQEAERKAAAAGAALADRPSVRGARCAPNSAGFGPVKAFVGDAGHWLRCIFGVQTVGGVGGRPGESDHPSGLALDFMVNKATGDQLADYALKYRSELKIKYVIWRQRINFGSGWQAMEDRGSPTANHLDHVHVSFGSA